MAIDFDIKFFINSNEISCWNQISEKIGVGNIFEIFKMFIKFISASFEIIVDTPVVNVKLIATCDFNIEIYINRIQISCWIQKYKN